MKTLKLIFLFGITISLAACGGDTSEANEDESSADSTEVVTDGEKECGPDCKKKCCSKKKKCGKKKCCKKDKKQCCMDEDCDGDCGMMHCCTDENCDDNCGKDHCCTDEDCAGECGKIHAEMMCEDGCKKECCTAEETE